MGQHLLHHEAKLLRALANPKRLEIVQLLSHQSLTLSELQEMTGLRQSDLSQNLAFMKRGQIIIAERQSRNIVYHLAHPNFSLIKTLLHQALAKKPLAISRKIHKVKKVIDPVCGMAIAPVASEWQSIYKGATYYFCASGCFHKFTKRPEEYVRH
jgi:YHS domain-containing protein